MNKKYTFYLITALCACVGIVFGAYSARKIVGNHKETIQLERATKVREWPSELADVISLNKSDKLEVLSQADFTGKNKDVPTIVKVNEQLKIVDKETKQQYVVKEGTYYQIAAKKKNSYVIKATTNKGNQVELELNAKDITPLEEGLWKHVKDKTGYMGWVRVK